MNMNENLKYIPACALAGDAAKNADMRQRLAQKLKDGQVVTVGQNGRLDPEGSTVVPDGILANPVDTQLSQMRQRLAQKLRDGQPVPVGSNGRLNNDSTISTPRGKLAAQWYEKNPELLEQECAAMRHCGFSSFELTMLPDNRLAWTGYLEPGILPEKTHWQVRAVYNNNHPMQVMGSSVRVYLIHPTIDDLIEILGERPSHLLRDSEGGVYLCTSRAEDVLVGDVSTSAASVLLWAVKWLMCLELVLMGDLTMAEFNKHDGI